MRGRFSEWACAGSLLLAASFANAAETGPFVIFYAADAPVEVFDAFALVVLDATDHPPLEPLSARGKTVLGYLSLGEVSDHQAHYHATEESGILVAENPNWPGSYLVDLRSRLWKDRVVGELVPSVLAQGFDGVFLDTLDNASYLEARDPVRFEGMTDAAAELVHTIRRDHPDVILMMNRAYEILPVVEEYIDIVLGESVRTRYDFAAKGYVRVEETVYREQVHLLQAARARRPSLRVLTLDYWYPR